MSADGRHEELRRLNPDACPVVETLEVVGTTWRINVLLDLREGEKRFNDLKRSTGARSKTLSGALEALSDRGLVERRVEAEAPIAVYYELTAKGEALCPVLDDLAEWAEEWESFTDRPLLSG